MKKPNRRRQVKRMSADERRQAGLRKLLTEPSVLERPMPRTFTWTAWDSEQKNSAFCGHMLVIFAFAINLVGWMLAPMSFKAAAGYGIICAVLAVAIAWYIAAASHKRVFMALSAIFTVLSYVVAIAWATKAGWL